MQIAAQAFQQYDHSRLHQMKCFFIQYSMALEDCYSSVTQVVADYKQNLQNIDIEDIMLRFIEERGTGSDRPRNFFF
jgi:hypothetical protein